MGRLRLHRSTLLAVLTATAAASASLVAETEPTVTTWRIIGLGRAAQSCGVEAFADAGCSKLLEAAWQLSASCEEGIAGEGELQLELVPGVRRPRCLRVPIGGGQWPEQDPLLEEWHGASASWLPRKGIEVRRAEGQRRLIFFQASSCGVHPALAILGSICLSIALGWLCHLPTTDIYLVCSKKAEDQNYGMEVCRRLGDSLGVSLRRHRSGEVSALRAETLGLYNALPLPNPQGVVPQLELDDRAWQDSPERRMRPYCLKANTPLPDGKERQVQAGLCWQQWKLDAILARCPVAGFCLAAMYVCLHAFLESLGLASSLALVVLVPAAAVLQALVSLPLEAAYHELPDGEYACRILSWCLVLVVPVALSLCLVVEAVQQPAPMPMGDVMLLGLAVIFLLTSLVPPMRSLISDVNTWSRIYRSLSVECPEFPWLNGTYNLQEASPCAFPVWMKEHDPWAGRRWMHSTPAAEGQKWCFSNTAPQAMGSSLGADEVVVSSLRPHRGALPQELPQDAWVAGRASGRRPSIGRPSWPPGDSSLGISARSRQSPVIVIIKPGSYGSEQERPDGARDGQGCWSLLCPWWRRTREEPDLCDVEPWLKVCAPCHPTMQHRLEGLYELCLGQTFREHPVWKHEGKDAYIHRHPTEERWAVGIWSGRQGVEQYEDFTFNEGYLMSPFCIRRGELPNHFPGKWCWKSQPSDLHATRDSSIRVEVYHQPLLSNFPGMIQVISPNLVRECEGEYRTVYGMTSERGYPVWRQTHGAQLFLFCVRSPGSRAGECLWCVGPRIMWEDDFSFEEALICGSAEEQPHLANQGCWQVWSPELGRHDIDPNVRFLEGRVSLLQDRFFPGRDHDPISSNEAPTETAAFPTDGVKVSYEQYMTPDVMDYQRNKDKWERAGVPPPEIPPEVAPEIPDPRVSYRRRISHGKWFGVRGWMYKAAGRTSQDFTDQMREMHEAQESAINAEADAYRMQQSRRGSIVDRFQAVAGGAWGRLSWRRGSQASAADASEAGPWWGGSSRREDLDPARLPQWPPQAPAGVDAEGAGSASRPQSWHCEEEQVRLPPWPPQGPLADARPEDSESGDSLLSSGSEDAPQKKKTRAKKEKDKGKDKSKHKDEVEKSKKKSKLPNSKEKKAKGEKQKGKKCKKEQDNICIVDAATGQPGPKGSGRRDRKQKSSKKPPHPVAKSGSEEQEAQSVAGSASDDVCLDSWSRQESQGLDKE